MAFRPIPWPCSQEPLYGIYSWITHAAPSAPPEDINATAISSTSIQLAWAPPPLDETNGIIREYRINITELETGDNQRLTTSTTSLVVQNLHPYYTYEVLVRAHTVDTGPFSSPVSVVTPQDSEFCVYECICMYVCHMCVC